MRLRPTLLMLMLAVMVGCGGQKTFDGAELHEAIRNNHDHLYGKILKEHPDWVKATDPEGNTPLHVACERDDLEAVSTLLSAGADPNATNNKGDTPLHLAARAIANPGGGEPGASEQERVQAVALTKGSGVEGKIKAKRALDQSGILTRLIKKGADPKVKNQAGETVVDILGKDRFDSVMDEVEHPGRDLPEF
ncbi:MAG: ankyrin repeat domain-containing protein [Candidatus Eremiobacteraeota bacterium]|nr:ankyrin repeat domain-containing protein [Candidatus Eremiobacteraeota bacterium]